MKKIVLFLLLFFPLGIFALIDLDSRCLKNWKLEVRGAYYHPSSSKKLRDVYTDHWLDYQVETSRRIFPYFEIWGGVCWACKEGRTRARVLTTDYDVTFKDHTKVFVIPLSLGVKFIYPILHCVDVYLGGGLCYSFLRIKNECKKHFSYLGIHGSPLKRVILERDWGGIIKSGFQIAMSKTTFLDFFADYFFQRFHFSHNNKGRNIFHNELDCSGFKIGVGFGVYF